MTGRLEVTTPSEREVAWRRRFEASRPLVWRAFTRPEIVQRWCWAMEHPMVECQMDVREGGSYRWVWRMPDGQDMVCHGAFREVVEPERMVQTQIFEMDWTGGETLVTTIFVEDGDATVVSVTVLYASREARDGALATGMVDGVSETYGKADAVLAEMAATL